MEILLILDPLRKQNNQYANVYAHLHTSNMKCREEEIAEWLGHVVLFGRTQVQFSAAYWIAHSHL